MADDSDKRPWYKGHSPEDALSRGICAIFIWWILLILSSFTGYSFDGAKAMLLAVIITVGWCLLDPPD